MARWKGLFGHTVPHSTVRAILPLAFFVLDHFPLFVEALLIDRPHKVTHAIGFHPQR